MSHPSRLIVRTTTSTITRIQRVLIIALAFILALGGVALSKSPALRDTLGLSAAPKPTVRQQPALPAAAIRRIDLLRMVGVNRASSQPSSLFSPMAPSVSASKTDALFTDVDGDLQADPGDTLKYTVDINAIGDDATGVTFTDTVDPNTAFVPGSLRATPVAVDETYAATGNIRISVAAPGVLGNDFAGVPGATITAPPSTSANGGDVTLNADGSFTYNPPAGFEGADTFTYTLTNSEGSNSATVTINVSGMIWFVNNAASCPCDGRLTNPFNTLASFQAVNNGAGNNPAANDNIFLYESASDYVGPVTLLNGQRFIGQDATASLSAITGLTPPAGSDPLPATNSSNGTIVNVTTGNAITVGSGNTLIGFTGGDSTTDISGTGFGTLTISDVTLNGAGQALNLSSGTLAATFGGISSTNSATTGISLTSVGGSMTTPTTTITNPGGIGISVGTSGATLSFGSTNATLSAGTGVSLLTNTGPITFGSLAIAPDAGQRGLLATDNSGVITTSGGAITTSGAIAVQITIGAGTTPLAVSQTSVSATGGTNGIVLTNTSGSFTVAGDGSLTRNGSGGTITTVTDDAVALTNASGVTLQSMNLTNNGDTAPASIVDAESTTGDQTVQISGGSSVVLSAVLIQNPIGSGIVALNLGGTNRVNSNSRITALAAGNRHGIFVNNVNTNMSVFEFKDSQMIDFSSAASAFFFANTGTSNMTLDVKGSTFEDLGIQAITAAAGGLAATTGTLTSIIGGPNAADRNFFQNAKGTGENNVGVLVNNGAVHDGTVQNNLFENIAKDGTIANTSIIRTQNNGGKMTAVVADNTIQNIAYATGGRHVIGHIFEPLVFNAADFSDLRFSGNTVTGVTYTGTNREFTFIDYRPTASGGDIKILNNNFNMPSVDAQQAFELRFRQTAASTVDLLVDGNTSTFNTTAPYLDIDSEAAAAVNATVTNNNFTNTNGTPGRMIDVASETATASLCGNISGNTINAGTGTIALTESAGNMTITQASAATLAAANGIPAGNVVVTGTPTFGSGACALPTNALVSTGPGSESLKMAAAPPEAKENDILYAERSEGPGDNRVSPLSPAALSIMVQAALAKWEDAGVSPSDLARLRAASFEVADLPEGQLAATSSGRITIDPTGAGYGWFYDVSPADDSEFELPVLNRQREALETSFAAGQMDLLTAVMRQLGSLIPRDQQKSHGWLMQNTLAPGVRRTPATAQPALSKLRPAAGVKGERAKSRATAKLTVAQRQANAASYQQVARLDDRRGTSLKHHVTFTPRAAMNSLMADVMLSIGTLPAGESVTITFNVTVDDPFTGALPQVSNQGTVSGSNFADVLTDDPSVGGTADPTVTPIDLPQVSIAVSPASVLEDGATNLVYTFTRTGSTANAMTVNFNVGGSASFTEPDYTQTGAATFTATSGTVVIPGGSSTATVTIDPSADTTVEGDETVDLTVTSGTGYSVGAPSAASGTITNDDADVSVAVAPASVAEDGATNLVYTFTRAGATSGALTVNFSVGGTANFGASPNDYTQTGAATYTSTSGTVTFGAGNSTATVTVNPEADTTIETDETVILTLTSGTGYNVSSPSSATGTITNDDADVSVAVSPAAVAEDGATNLVYTFTRTGFTAGALTVNFSVGGTAVFGPSPDDYTQTGATTFTTTTGSVTFGPGNSAATVTVNPETDSTAEADETVVITLTAGASYNVVSPSSATGTILNDDTLVSVAVAPSSTTEGGVNMVYTFTRTGPTTSALTVNFSVGGSASFPADYSQSGAATFTPPTATVTFAVGSSTKTVTVTPLTDCAVEGPETVVFTVQSGSGYGVGSPSSASGAITNTPDSTPPTITCNADIVADFNPAVGGAVVTFAAPVGSDNCPGATTAQIAGLPSGSTFPLGTTTITFRVTDAAGNTADCSFKVTVALTSIIGLDSVNISGASFIDSYNSAIGYPASKSSLANVLSNGTITMGNSGKVWGNVRSTQAGINMTGASQVTGNATAGTTVSLSGSASVGGTITNHAPSPAMTLPAVPACGPPYSPNSGISGTYSYNPGTGDLSLSGVNIATLANGTYCFHNITLGNSAQLKVNGLVTIKMTGTLNLSGATSFTNTTGMPGNLRVLSSLASGGNGVVLGNSTNVTMVIYAPQTGVSISGAAPLFGTVAAKRIILGNSGAIHYDTQLKTIWPDLWVMIVGP